MKKILTLAFLMIGSLIATAQDKLPVFDRLDDVTIKNHGELLPADFKLVEYGKYTFKYVNENNDILTFKFEDNERFVCLKTNNINLAGGESLYDFKEYQSKGGVVSMDDKDGKYVYKNTDTDYVFYSEKFMKDKLTQYGLRKFKFDKN